MCLQKKIHSILILKIKAKLLALKKHKEDIKSVWIPAHMGIALIKITDASAMVQYLMPVTDMKSYWKTKLQVAAEVGTENQGNKKEVL